MNPGELAAFEFFYDALMAVAVGFFVAGLVGSSATGAAAGVFHGYIAMGVVLLFCAMISKFFIGSMNP